MNNDDRLFSDERIGSNTGDFLEVEITIRNAGGDTLASHNAIGVESAVDMLYKMERAIQRGEVLSEDKEDF